MSTSTSTRARHELKHSSASTGTRARTNTRALEHEHQSTRARARCALDHEHGRSSTSTRWPGNQCEPLGERHAKPVRLFFNHVGLHAPGWLYVFGMPPRGYLPVFATLNPQSTCHGPRPGLILAPWYTDGLPACPGAESARKDPRPEEKKCRYAKKAHLYMVILVRTFEYLIQVVHLRQGNKSESSTSTVRGPRKREVRSHQASRLYTGVNDLQYKQ